MDVFEHSGAASLIMLLDEITHTSANWGIARIKKNYLRPITDQAFVFAIRAALQETDIAHIFFVDRKRIFVVWNSQTKSIYRQIRSLVSTSLVHPGSIADASAIVAYLDPAISGQILRTALKAPEATSAHIFDKAENFPIAADIFADPDATADIMGDKSGLVATPVQIAQLQEMRSDKKCRKQIQFLVVEDQAFSQKLLCEILRSVRVHNNNETPLIDTVISVQEAWKTYLKRLPDITFIDLNLIDGSGHTLARAIKEFDPGSCVIIVTANNFEEEHIVARQNNVDGFISKPYNKKQIMECIERYVGNGKLQSGGRRGHHH